MNTITVEQKKINNTFESPLVLFRDTLPQKPYCTDELGNLFIRPALQAIKRKYIQPNSPHDLRWLVYDVDRPTAHFDWYDLKVPPPNITVMNKENGHAHLLYGLSVPVYKQPEAHQKPLRYAASIDVALSRTLEADPGYSGLICKNPLHNYWDIQVWQKYAYDLNLMADFLDLEPYQDRRTYLPPVGLGRNCTMFDLTRHWAYKEIRKDNFLNEDFFIYECIAYAAGKNDTFPIPLPYSEVKATGKSIGRWTYRNMSPAGFKNWGDNRRKKSITVRKTKAQERTEGIRAYKLDHPEATNKDISTLFQVSLRTVAGLKLSRL